MSDQRLRSSEAMSHDKDDPHISPELISAYLDQELSTDERESVQRHLLRCKECRADLAEASELGMTRGRMPRWAWAVPAAAAVIAALLLVPGAGERTNDAPLLRGDQTEEIARFEAVSPSEGQHVSRDSVIFLWRGEGAGTYYELTLTDQNGDVVWTTGTSDTTLTLPEDVRLVPGQEYFWYVDALLEGAQPSTTGVRDFRVRR